MKIDSKLLDLLGECRYLVKWVEKNLDGLEVDLLQAVQGDHEGYISRLKTIHPTEVSRENGNTRLTLPDDITVIYDTEGRKIQHQEPKGVSWKMKFDDNGNQTFYRNSLGEQWEDTYNSNGKKVSHVNNNGSWEKTFKVGKNIERWENSAGNFWEQTFDNEGRVVSFKTDNNHGWEKEYDRKGRQTSFKTDSGYTRESRYDENDRLVYQLDGKDITIFNYSREGHLLRMIKNGKVTLEIPEAQGIKKVGSENLVQKTGDI
jgi:YD repeat-containing protein